MAVKFSQGVYQPLNPSKYIGKKKYPTYRSGWELTIMRFFDNHPSVQFWSSESEKIPYYNPLTGKQTIYIPDFFIVYIDSNGKNMLK